MNIVCGKCKTSFGTKEIGVYMVEMFNNPPRPYKIWNADRMVCKCGEEVFSGFGLNSMMMQHEPGFEEMLEKLKVDGNVYYWQGRLYD